MVTLAQRVAELNATDLTALLAALGPQKQRQIIRIARGLTNQEPREPAVATPVPVRGGRKVRIKGDRHLQNDMHAV